MKFSCKKEALVQAVNNVSRAISGKTTILALEGILMKAQNNELILTGYDLEIAITTSIPAAVQEPGELILTAKLFADMVRRMPQEDIFIESDEKLLTQIKSGVTEFTILGLKAEEFPELPVLHEKESVSIDQLKLKSMVEQTTFAVAVTDSKPVHTGCLFDMEEDSMNMVAVDGFRLALRHEKLSEGKKMRFIVPAKALQEVSRLIGEEEGVLKMELSSKHILFRVENYSVISRLLEGEFLDYRSAIPKAPTTTVRVSVRSFSESVERSSLLISDRLKSPLRVRFEENCTRISCQTAMGKSYDEFACAMEGNAVEMGFNNKYLLDALKNSGCDEVKLEICGPLSPMKVLPPQGEDFLFLVLPVRLKNEI